MKRFVFAVQLFGIIALFPIYVILEMKHGLPEFNDHGVGKEMIEETSIQVFQNGETKNEISIPGRILMNSTVMPGKNEIIRALAEAAYKSN